VITLKTPICSFDAKTGILCTKCETKLKSGHLTSVDVEVAIKLTKLAERNQDINKFTMLGAAKVDGDFVLTLRGVDVIMLRSDAALLRKLEDEFKSKVWFVEAEGSDRRFIENLFFPTNIQTINLVWLPDGNKLTKVIISNGKNTRSRITVEKIQKIAKAVRNIELLVDFEQQN
jgi:transcription antitermination factor NusA-like protein